MMRGLAWSRMQGWQPTRGGGLISIAWESIQSPRPAWAEVPLPGVIVVKSSGTVAKLCTAPLSAVALVAASSFNSIGASRCCTLTGESNC